MVRAMVEDEGLDISYDELLLLLSLKMKIEPRKDHRATEGHDLEVGGLRWKWLQGIVLMQSRKR